MCCGRFSIWMCDVFIGRLFIENGLFYYSIDSLWKGFHVMDIEGENYVKYRNFCFFFLKNERYFMNSCDFVYEMLSLWRNCK